ncbi:MAG: ankyrin repeat domain-containing protein, partial [archaeon]|nr:ankyrin repeat domain-containing protein [archaeon]
MEALEALLDSGAFGGALTKNHASALHYLVQHSGMSRSALDWLIPRLNVVRDPGQPLPINLQNVAGETPLHRAVSRNAAAQVDALLRHVANPQVPNRHSDLPLHLAVRGGFHEVAQMLLLAGSHPDAPGRDGVSARQLGSADPLFQAIFQDPSRPLLPSAPSLSPQVLLSPPPSFSPSLPSTTGSSAAYLAFLQTARGREEIVRLDRLANEGHYITYAPDPRLPAEARACAALLLSPEPLCPVEEYMKCPSFRVGSHGSSNTRTATLSQISMTNMMAHMTFSSSPQFSAPPPPSASSPQPSFQPSPQQQPLHPQHIQQIFQQQSSPQLSNLQPSAAASSPADVVSASSERHIQLHGWKAVPDDFNVAEAREMLGRRKTEPEPAAAPLPIVAVAAAAAAAPEGRRAGTLVHDFAKLAQAAKAAQMTKDGPPSEADLQAAKSAQDAAEAARVARLQAEDARRRYEEELASQQARREQEDRLLLAARQQAALNAPSAAAAGSNGPPSRAPPQAPGSGTGLAAGAGTRGLVSHRGASAVSPRPTNSIRITPGALAPPPVAHRNRSPVGGTGSDDESVSAEDPSTVIVGRPGAASGFGTTAAAAAAT